ncbi:MAG: hypothetical protein ABI794_13935 [Betaproteobacteria bacterium]
MIVERRAKSVRPEQRDHQDAEEAARDFIRRDSLRPEARVLARLMDALRLRKGDFQEADALALGPEALAIASALIAGKLQGLVTEPDPVTPWNWRKEDR